MEDRNKSISLAERFADACRDLGCPVEVLGSRETESGASIDIRPAAGIRIEDVIGIRDDVALRLGLYYIQVIPPGNGSWKLTVNMLTERPQQRTPLECAADANAGEGGLRLCIGGGITGDPVMLDLHEDRSVLVAGMDVEGNMDFMHAMDDEIRLSGTWKDVRIIRTDGAEGYGPLARLCQKVEDGVPVPETVLVINRYEELIRVHGDDAEDLVFRLLVTRRTDALHLVLVTSQPAPDVVTGVIAWNVPAKISFRLRNGIDSRTVVRTAGAECLAGRGEGLLVTDAGRNPEWFIAPVRDDGTADREGTWNGKDCSAILGEITGRNDIADDMTLAEALGVASGEYRQDRIADLDLSVRAYNCLTRFLNPPLANYPGREDLERVSDLLDMTVAEFRKVRNLGAEAFAETVLKVSQLVKRDVRGMEQFCESSFSAFRTALAFDAAESIMPADSESLEVYVSCLVNAEEDTFECAGTVRETIETAMDGPAVKEMNPLIVRGGSARRNLLTFIRYQYLLNHPSGKALGTSADVFVSEFDVAQKSGNADAFREKYTDLDLLLLDDVGALSGRPDVCEELFGVFDRLYVKNSRIVFGIEPDTDLQGPGFPERLRTRFSWGREADLQSVAETQDQDMKNGAIPQNQDLEKG